MPGAEQHYLPAALIGGFGDLHEGGTHLRDATVVVWRPGSKEPWETSAEKIGWRKGTYTIPGLGPDLQDVVDGLWDVYEPNLPAAIRALSSGICDDEDIETLRWHIACCAVRLPHFPELLSDWHEAQGLLLPTEEEARLSRLLWIEAGLGMISWRWRAIHAQEGLGPPFLLPDTGFVQFRTEDEQELLLMPMAPDVALLGSRDTLENGLAAIDHRTAKVSTMEWLNHLLAEAPGRTMSMAHPSRRGWLARVVSRSVEELPCPSEGGFYVGKTENWMGRT